MPASHSTQTLRADQEELFGRRIALLSISVGLVLSVTKITVGMKAGSTAVISDGLEAAGDVLSSTIVYAGLWLAARPPDQEHPYGHGRYETLAGLAVGGLLLLTGAAILWHGLTSLGQHSRPLSFAVYPLLGAVVAKLALAVTKFRVGRKIASSGLEADAWHDVTDLLSTTVALVAVLLTIARPEQFGSADHIGGIVIGIIILFLSVAVVKNTVGQLLDTMPEPSRMSEIRKAALSVPGTLGIEKCLARRTGLKYHVDLHLEVHPDMTVRESHQIATAAKIAIKEQLPWVADVLIHVEPSDAVAQRRVEAGIRARS